MIEPRGNEEGDSLYTSLPSEELQTSLKNQIIYLRTQLMQLIESKESKPDCDNTLLQLLNIDVPLQNKCHSLLINNLLGHNSTEPDVLIKLSAAFNILYRYGRNLLKEPHERPHYWRAVKFTNNVFHTKVDSLKGGRHILCQLGYTQEINGGLAFPNDTEPHRDTVAEISADLLIGKYEIDEYVKGQHPFPFHIEVHISLTARIPQRCNNLATSTEIKSAMPGPVVSHGLTSTSNNEMNRKPPSGGVALFGMAMGVGPHLLKKTSPPKQTLLGTPAQIPISAVESRQSGETVDKPDCPLCGLRQETFKYCQTCSKHHCSDCDNMWHNHPNRKNHIRTEIPAGRQKVQGVMPHQTNAAAQDSGSRIAVQKRPGDPSSNVSTVHDLIRQREKATAKGGFINDEVKKQPASFDQDARVMSPSQAKAYFEQRFSVGDAAARKGFQFAGKVSGVQKDITGQSSASPNIASEENTYVVIPRRDTGPTSFLNTEPSSIEAESIYSSMHPGANVSENNQTNQGLVGGTSRPNKKPPVPPPKPKLLKKPSFSSKKDVPAVPPKPHLHHDKDMKVGSTILEGLMKVEPSVRQVMLDKELKKLEIDSKGLQDGIKIYADMGKERDRECERMKNVLAENQKEFRELCEYREQFGIGKYVPETDVMAIEKNVPAGVAKYLPRSSDEDVNKNKSEKLLPKQAWPDKDVIPKSAFVEAPSPALHGVSSGDLDDDMDILRPPPIRPLDSLGSFAPLSVQQVPTRRDESVEKVDEIPQSRWECQFCTFHNERGSNKCLMCESINVNPKYLDQQEDVKTAAQRFEKMMLEVPLDQRSRTRSMEDLDLKEKGMLDMFKSQTLGHRISKQEEERRLHRQLEADGKSIVERLRNVEGHEGGDYNIDKFEIASRLCNDWGLEPFEWLQEYWDQFKDNALAQAIHVGKNDVQDVLSTLSMDELEAALLECKDVEKAIEKCRTNRKRMVEELRSVTEIPVADIIKMIGECKGNEDDVIKKIDEAVMQEVLDAVREEEEDEDVLIRQEGFLHFIQNEEVELERRLRALLVQGQMERWVDAEIVLGILDDRTLDLDRASLEDIISAATEAAGDIVRCKSYLQQECEICFCVFPMNKIRNLVHCQCKLCEGCLTENVQVAARDREARHMACPVCGEPDLQNDEARAATHFQILDLIVKNLLDDDTYQLFQRKLRDWSLMKDPNFRWCSHCECGIIFTNEDGQLKMTCPECHHGTCFSCKEKWEDQHDGLTCEQFRQWKYDNNPELQAAGLAKHLEENGIDCPSCKFRFTLARGGCMHFTCTQCGFQFCSGCYNPFKRGDTCDISSRCASAGLHCHHPRDCLYYLRDYDVPVLKKLLENKEIEVRTSVSQEGEPAEENPKCSVLEQKETPDGLKDEPCGKDTNENEAGLCVIHYKEYLVMLINTHEIDPVEIMELDDLKHLLERLDKSIPNQRKKESQGQYKKRLREYIKTNVSLARTQRRMLLM